MSEDTQYVRIPKKVIEHILSELKKIRESLKRA